MTGGLSPGEQCTVTAKLAPTTGVSGQQFNDVLKAAGAARSIQGTIQ